MYGSEGVLDMEKVEKLRAVTKWRAENIGQAKVKEVVHYGEAR
jgi:hypothetical protein